MPTKTYRVKICRNIKCAFQFIIISVQASEGLEELFEFVEYTASRHPWAGEDLSLKIDEHDKTIWNFIPEL